jgi:RNA polymerase sigma-70 factor, ECF subfamily
LGYREGISAEEVDRLDLLQALERLDDPLKTVVILKYFQDLPLTEVAEVLGCPVGTAKSYLHRALKILRLELKEDCR